MADDQKQLPEPKERTIEDRIARLERWLRERASETERAHPSWIDAPDPEPPAEASKG